MVLVKENMAASMPWAAPFIKADPPTRQLPFYHNYRSTHAIAPLSFSKPVLVRAATTGRFASEASLSDRTSLPSAYVRISSDTVSSPLSPIPVADEEGGPVELPEYEDPLAFPENVSPLQTVASVLFSGAVGFLLYRSLRRRMKMAKETKLRSSGITNVNDAARKAAILGEKTAAADVKPATPPTAWQAFQGAVIAGGIAFILYKFTTYVEAGFASKPVSSVYTVRQLTITIRTIVNGLCYLATFVFAANSIGLFVYSLQLLLNIGGPTEITKEGKNERLADHDPLIDESSLEDVKRD
ncbi:hypothetical protein KP509_07G085000 [Ceratopteris richardii]|uniref:Uncharacterized protein n=1 Tax=Ceratopteris richardii TaxID=49495 RepID=A0A8T2UIV7_CERRI|nr:hypothetical protein KP509_07G085000 [Ceratopteris richardii]